MNKTSEDPGFQFSDQRQQAIHDLLTRLVGPGPAAFFRDACRLMSGATDLQASSHLGGHAIREVESAIRDVLLPFGRRVGREPGKAPRQKVRDNQHTMEVREILTHLELSEDDHVAVLWLEVAAVGIADRAHRAALDGPRPLDQEFMDFWDKMQAILFEVLRRFERRLTNITGPLLDELLKKEVPSKSDLARLRNNVPASSVLRHGFFERVGPGWLKPLSDAGFFNYPPPPEHVSQTAVRFPPWPLSQCLVRMATTGNRAIQQLVLRIALAIPRTDNVAVRADLAELSQRLPTSLAVRLVPTYVSLLSTSRYLQYEPVILSKFAVTLAKQGRRLASLQLVSELLAVMPDSTYANSARETAGLPPRPRWRAYDWDLVTLHDETLPALADALGVDMLKILARQLKRAVELSMTPRARRQRGSDLSDMWLPSFSLVEESTHDVEVELAHALATASIGVIERDHRRIHGVVRVLQRRRWAIFDRIRLHVLANTAVIDKALIAGALLDERLMTDWTVRVEYTALLKARFGVLRARDKRQVFEMLASRGLNVGRMKGETVEEREKRRDRLILGRLELVKEHLTGSWKEYYSELRAREVTAIRWDEPNPTVEVSVGDRSPLGVEDLKKMEVSEITAYLKTWEPPESEWEASPEGLARALSVVVESDPRRFAEHATQFQGLDPTYVSWFLHGLDAAVRAGQAIPWEELVLLCKWIVAQPRDEAARHRSRYSDLDPGWGWTRKAIASLLSDGLRQPSQVLPIHLRDDVWNILQVLSDDPHPTAEDEMRHGGDAMDAYEFSINATRGEAIEAVIAYVLWVQASLITTDETPRTLALVPEAEEVLDRHLDVARDPSRAVRAVYGRWFGNLYHADATWAAEHVARIFPGRLEEQSLWVAAWESFLWNRPHRLLYTALRGQYVLALERMGVTVKRNAHTRDPRTRLGIHLSMLFIREELPAEDERLVSDFFTKAPLDVRRAVIADVGRNLRQAGTLPDKTIERIKAFWGLRLGVVGILENSDLGAFGDWFASERIDEDWSYPQFATALSRGGTLQGGHNIVKKLAKDATQRTSQVLECLDLIIDGEKSEWHLGFWKDDIVTVLQSGLASALGDDRRRARETTNRLVARGYAHYGALLTNPPPNTP